MLYAVIIAGGAGKRLWPSSRRALPKFLLKIKGKRSLLQQTVDRIRPLIPINNILIIPNKEQARIVSREVPALPQKNIIAEPLSRNTAPAVCIAAALVNKKDSDGIIFVLPVDHIIEDKEGIRQIFGFAALMARIKDCLLTIGIKPTYPATGYGYIKTGPLYRRLLADKSLGVYQVAKFVEKPTLKKAKAFFKSKGYLWNSGIFIGRAKTFLDEFKRYKHSIYRIAQKIEKGLGTKKGQDLIHRYYEEFPGLSIDYAIMEKTKKAYVIKAALSWLDIGSWQSLEGYLKKDSKGNIVIGNHLGIETRGSIIVGEKNHLLATLGVNNIVLIQTKDATLICAKDRAEDVKGLVELAERKGLKSYL